MRRVESVSVMVRCYIATRKSFHPQTQVLVLTLNSCPCLTCSVKIVQVGITEVVFSQSYHMDIQSAKIFQEAGVHLRQYAPVGILLMRGVLPLTIGSHEKDLSIFVTLVLETLIKHEEWPDQCS